MKEKLQRDLMKEKLQRDLKSLRNIWVRVVISIAFGFIAIDFTECLYELENILLLGLVFFALLYLLVVWLYSDDKIEETK